MELNEESRKRVQAGIQELILHELAGHFPNPDDPGPKSKHLGNR
ncbi:MAG: hypothetical protein JWP78_898 [Mucilaginibacter sp.]|nr:hypothetical protein [Mucilaginibacter sp.]